MQAKLVMAAAALGLCLACGSDKTTGPSTGVTVGDNTFTPQTLTLSTNRTVTWSWAGARNHNVTFEDGFTASATQSSGSFSRDFTGATSGPHRYRCTLHSANFTSGMVGSVVVP